MRTAAGRGRCTPAAQLPRKGEAGERRQSTWAESSSEVAAAAEGASRVAEAAGGEAGVGGGACLMLRWQQGAQASMGFGSAWAETASKIEDGGHSPPRGGIVPLSFLPSSETCVNPVRELSSDGKVPVRSLYSLRKEEKNR